MKKKRINLTMDEKVYKELRKRAIDENLSVSQLLENLAVDYLNKTKKTPYIPTNKFGGFTANMVRELIGGRIVLIEVDKEPKLIKRYEEFNFENIESDSEFTQLMQWINSY